MQQHQQFGAVDGGHRGSSVVGIAGTGNFQGFSNVNNNQSATSSGNLDRRHHHYGPSAQNDVGTTTPSTIATTGVDSTAHSNTHHSSSPAIGSHRRGYGGRVAAPQQGYTNAPDGNPAATNFGHGGYSYGQQGSLRSGVGLLENGHGYDPTYSPLRSEGFRSPPPPPPNPRNYRTSHLDPVPPKAYGDGRGWHEPAGSWTKFPESSRLQPKDQYNPALFEPDSRQQMEDVLTTEGYYKLDEESEANLATYHPPAIQGRQAQLPIAFLYKNLDALKFEIDQEKTRALKRKSARKKKEEASTANVIKQLAPKFLESNERSQQQTRTAQLETLQSGERIQKQLLDALSKTGSGEVVKLPGDDVDDDASDDDDTSDDDDQNPLPTYTLFQYDDSRGANGRHCDRSLAQEGSSRGEMLLVKAFHSDGTDVKVKTGLVSKLSLIKPLLDLGDKKIKREFTSLLRMLNRNDFGVITQRHESAHSPDFRGVKHQSNLARDMNRCSEYLINLVNSVSSRQVNAVIDPRLRIVKCPALEGEEKSHEESKRALEESKSALAEALDETKRVRSEAHDDKKSLQDTVQYRGRLINLLVAHHGISAEEFRAIKAKLDNSDHEESRDDTAGSGGNGRPSKRARFEI